jgi:translocation and assembly module TamB
LIWLLGLIWRLVATCLMALLGLAVSFWLWSGSNGSLATALHYALPQLPAGQTAVVSAVNGSLRDGGQIGRLRWQGLGFVIEATDVTVAWDWRGLLQRELRLSRLAVRRVVVEDNRPPSPARPPGDLSLPLRLSAQVSVTELDWHGTAPLQLQLRQLAGNYIFDSEEHRLDKGEVRISSGTYQVQGHMQARAPQALSLTVSGTVQTRVPSITQLMNLQAQASLEGVLAGTDAELQLRAKLQPSTGGGGQRSPVQADVQARLRPWQAQPVVSATANWQGLDLAALWPQAPHTLSSGQATVAPSGPGWRADVKLDNRQSASLDRQGLPIDQLQAALLYRDGSWLLESVLASSAGGRIEGRGSYIAKAGQSESPVWQGSATLRNINPRALHSQLPAANLDGELTASQSGAGLSFSANLQTRAGLSAGQNPLAQIGQRLKAIGLEGHWRTPRLQLDRLDLQTDEARLGGQLALDTQSRTAEGRLNLTLPGGAAQLNGTLASGTGGGDIKLNITQAALAARWLSQWPGVAGTAAYLPRGGELQLDGRWQGGWQNFERDLQLTLALRSPRLDLPGQGASGSNWQLRDLQADLSGRLDALAFNAQALSLRNEQRLQVQTRGRAALLAEGHWEVQVAQAQLGLQDPALPGRWAMQLSQAAMLNWVQRGTNSTLTLSAGSLELSGPAPGTAQVAWQPARWSHGTARPEEPAEWQSQGRIDGLPLAWLELLGQTRIANLGLRGNLVFGGEWDARGGTALQVTASLARTSGDLRLLTEEVQLGALSNLGDLNAGVRQARLRLLIEGAQLKALLDWDSERAGQAQAELASLLQTGPDGWHWPAEAPLSGTLKVQLPPVGAWSLLAPPGWRLRGTLDADATLYGTRAAPLWRGRLQAQDLAVRSVADGIDFSQGQLRVRLDGQSMEIEEFTLRGATLAGSSGGTVTVAGNVRWPVSDGRTATPLLNRLRMDLVAQARSLRVSARVDRRLVISGQLKANLEGGQLALRGTLTADQALFILPEDSAPQLGDDVRVRRPGAPVVTAAPVKEPVVLGLRPDVLLTLDLGPDFQVRGRGLITRVAGSVTLRNVNERSLAPLLRGELRTVQGSYKAYGQQLDIEAGVLRFAGPYDNPALDILAIRPNLSQRVGVQITGTAIAPVVRLYAEPELPEAEKLAWLVLGRSAGTGGAEAAVLQQAALALLGGTGRGLPGSLGQALGLDEVTMRGSTSNADGTTTGATVTVGKRLSRDFYVAYERSLAGTLGTLYIFFDLSRRLTLRAQTGEQSAVDLIFTLRYD